MFDLGLDPAEFDALVNNLAGSEQIRTRVFLLDLDHKLVKDLSALGPDGSTSINMGGDVQATASASLFDPLGESGFDEVTDLASVRPPDRLLQVYRGSLVAGKWVDVPVFCGVVTDVSRDGDYLTLSAESKDVLALDKPWRALTVNKGTLVSEAVRLILSSMTGETRFKIQTTTQKLGKNVSVGADTSPLLVVRELLTSIGWVGFYDAEGYFVVKPPSNDPVFTLTDGVGGLITSEVARDYRTDGIVNAVRVISNYGKTSITAESVAAANHPYAPEKLGRNGVGRFIWELVESDVSLSLTEAKDLAESELQRLLLDSVSVSFDALPVPFLEGHDVVRVEADNVGLDFRIMQVTVPWGLGVSSFGYEPTLSAFNKRLAGRVSGTRKVKRKKKKKK